MTLTISDKITIENALDPLGGAIKRTDESVPPSSRAAHVLYQDLRRRPKGEAAKTSEITPEAALVQLHTAQSEHPFWSNKLFKACAAGTLTKDDFKFIFSQYYLYSKNFTRYLAALMANCDSDYHRSRLSENLWEEGGGIAPEKRHAEIFRRFLVDGLEIDIHNIDYLDSTRFFVREYLDFCLHSHPSAGSAFLSLGTEGIVAKMYGVLLEGLLNAGITEEHTTFFRLHMECDDEHAETLEKIMTSYATMPDWYNTCYRSMTHALSLRERFFDQLYRQLEIQRIRPIIDNIQNRESLVPDLPSPSELHYRMGAAAPQLYSNVNERLNIDFNVERIPFKADVFDPRILRIAPHKNNEKHKHPHESIFYVIKGEGKVHVNEAEVDIKPGDVVFVPRWAMHQTHNTGSEELLVLALTDFGLTEKAFLGEHLKSTRLKGTQAAR
jgi:pyrroloquinoline quinone (PQQ) biosynthesis protein C/mannose-6-phosphate isomerase-like protein (cupin superfamily)